LEDAKDLETPLVVFLLRLRLVDELPDGPGHLLVGPEDEALVELMLSEDLVGLNAVELQSVIHYIILTNY